MKKGITILAAGAVFICLTGIVSAQDMIIYPAKGQSQEQLEKDKYECYSWAKKQTGFDPIQMPTASAPPPKQEPRRGGLGRGAARGAAAGAAIGSLDGEMGKGAAAGAVAGGLIGGIRRQEQAASQKQKEQQWAQQEATQYAGNRSEYNRAYAACLEGRGYTVK